jgi:uncharacterized repeat protein (TIGR03803 family)
MFVQAGSTSTRKSMLGITFALLLLGGATIAPAQTFTLLNSFDGYNGYGSEAGLVQGTYGNFYGATYYGSNLGQGNVYQATPSGTLFTEHKFWAPSDGVYPVGALVLATNGKLYGTAQESGPGGWGTAFSITQTGTFTTLHDFALSDGGYPAGPMVQATNGNLYGITLYGGSGSGGTFFEMSLTGTLSTIYNFSNGGFSVPVFGLIQAKDGNFYGISLYGGLGYGGIFKITAGGVLTSLYSFTNGSDGASPQGPLVQATNGNFYGTTNSAGAHGYGTVFGMSPAGVVHTLYSFAGTDGANPAAGLIQATDGNFYGTTSAGGANGDGTIFQVTPTGALTSLHDFNGAIDGTNSQAPLVQGTDGSFYGTTYAGGANNIGTIFNESVGLGPFVRTNPTTGSAGKPVRILGNNLTGSTSVTFNGVAAAFTIVSDNEITTNVPVGATSGTVEVTTPSGALNSNIIFRIM